MFSVFKRHFMKRAIDIALRRQVPMRFSLTSPAARYLHCYETRLTNGTERPFMLITGRDSENVTGLISDETGKNALSHAVPIKELASYDLFIKHYFWGYVSDTHKVYAFLLQELCFYMIFACIYGKSIQFFFNIVPVPRRDRVGILRYFLNCTIDDPNFRQGNTTVISGIMSSRWLYRNDNVQIHSYYNLMLDSLVADHDLINENGGYKIAPKALKTIAAFDEEERRHKANLRIQSAIVALTMVLAATGLANYLWPLPTPG